MGNSPTGNVGDGNSCLVLVAASASVSSLLVLYTPVCVAGEEDPGVAEAEVVEVPDSGNFAVTSTTVRLLAQCDPVNSKLS